MSSSPMRQYSRVLPAFVFGLTVSLAPSIGDAQIQSSAQQSCILGMNKALSKVAKAQHRVVSDCVKDITEGVLPASPGAVDSCLAGPHARVAKAVAKVAKVDGKKCTTVPSFGYVPAASSSASTIAQTTEHLHDLLGADAETPLTPGSSTALRAACQRSIAKTYPRVNDARLKTFIDCKKNGLKTGLFQSSADLESCYEAINLDGKGRIGKSFQKLARAYLKRCLEVPDISAAFPGDCLGAPDLLTCMDEQSRCRTCLTLNLTDNLGEACELYDNGVADGSCVDPAANECAGDNGGNNCHENATCNDEVDGFTCTCDAGYEGDGVNCADIDECVTGTDNCHADATCTNTEASFECACNLGYSGDGVTCVDENECIGEGSGNNCHADATCTNTAGGFVCACDPGYVGTGTDCIDQNECAMFSDNCDRVNGFCTNVPGSFTCTCNPGYGGDPTNCVDFDECAGEGGGNDCHANAECTNLPASFSCACAPGYSGDGVAVCDDIDECGTGTDNCHADATCTNTPGSFDCDCNTGFGGDGVSCVDFDECIGEGVGSNCSVNATCTNLPGSHTCDCFNGYYGNPVGSTCQPISVTITSPIHGLYSQAGTIGVTGVVIANPYADVSLTITAGDDPPVVVPINPGDGTFSTTVPLDPALIFNGIKAEVTQISTGFTIRDRVVVVAGDSRPYGGEVEQSVGLRITDTGFNVFEPILTSLVDLDPSTLIPPGTKILDDECFLTIIVCVIEVDATVASAGITNFGLDIDSQTNQLVGTITLTNLEVFVDITGDISCTLRVFSPITTITGQYALGPDPSDNTILDVNQLSDVTVGFSNFASQFISGVCDDPIIGDIIQAVMGDIEPTVRDGFIDFLKDPDGGGPADAPIAQAIEDTLGAVELTGPIGAAFGVNLATPLFSVPEDNFGVTLASGAVMSTITPDPSAPVITETYFLPQTYPFTELSTGTSPNGHVYDMAIVISDSAFNQVLASQVESGSMSTEVTQVEFVPGTGLQTITAGILSSFLPEFGQLDPATELKLRVSPTLPPALSGNVGAAGEIAELLISHMIIEVVTVDAPEVNYGVIAVDILSAFDLTISGGGGELIPALSEPDPMDIVLTLLDNPLGASEATLQATLPGFVAPLIPSLAGAFGSFPLPAFLGLQPTPVDVTRTGDFIGVFLTTTIAP